ncbi:hypothetical protein Ocin01_11827 [Orchesella cincta]|uniref:Uncharacterized protein n=1 Tax=Orchesella cincta TaxID=48709 RepID=A0A1D2MQ23_ORCCI|nr:hypothetical protein Ocin01_11827 [Orchesella cincta]
MTVKFSLFTAAFVLICNTISYADEEFNSHPPDPPQSTDSATDWLRLLIGGGLLFWRYSTNCYQLVKKLEELIKQKGVSKKQVTCVRVSVLFWSFLLWKFSALYVKCAKESNCTNLVGGGVFHAFMNKICKKDSCGNYIQIPIALLTLLSEIAVWKYPLTPSEQLDPEGPDNNMYLWLPEKIDDKKQVEPANEDDEQIYHAVNFEEETQIEPIVNVNEERQIEPIANVDEERQIDPAANENDGQIEPIANVDDDRQIEPAVHDDGMIRGDNPDYDDSEQVIIDGASPEQARNSSATEANTPGGSQKGSSTRRNRRMLNLSEVSSPSPRRSKRIQDLKKTPMIEL